MIKTARRLKVLPSAAKTQTEADQIGDQSTFNAPEPAPIEGAVWRPDRCVWAYRHWFIRTRRSIPLERALIEAAQVSQADELADF